MFFLRIIILLLATISLAEGKTIVTKNPIHQLSAPKFNENLIGTWLYQDSGEPALKIERAPGKGDIPGTKKMWYIVTVLSPAYRKVLEERVDKDELEDFQPKFEVHLLEVVIRRSIRNKFGIIFFEAKPLFRYKKEFSHLQNYTIGIVRWNGTLLIRPNKLEVFLIDNTEWVRRNDANGGWTRHETFGNDDMVLNESGAKVFSFYLYTIRNWSSSNNKTGTYFTKK